MQESETQRIANNRRRQAYFKRRRVVQAQARNGQPLAVERMTADQLTHLLLAELSLLLSDLADGSSPKNHHRAQVVSACVHELYERGEQMTLF